MIIVASKKHRKQLEKQIAALPEAALPPPNPMGCDIGPMAGMPIRFITKTYLKKVRIIDDSQFEMYDGISRYRMDVDVDFMRTADAQA